MKLRISLLIVLSTLTLYAQVTFVTQPQYPTETDQITITFDITNQTDSRTLVGYTGDVYTHTGVYINSETNWRYVIGTWGINSTQPQMTRVSSNVYSIVINNPRNFYGVTSPQEKITTLNFVLRSSDGTKQTEDIHVPLYNAGISVVLNSPTLSLNYGDPLRSPIFIFKNSTLPITATSTAGNNIKSIKLFINGSQVFSTTTNSLNFNFIENNYSNTKNEIKIVAEDVASRKDSVQFVIMKISAIRNLQIPAETQIGINYGTDNSSATLVLYAPQKKFIYVIGDFNDWKVDTTYYMNRDVSNADSLWWIKLNNLQSGNEYAYQFLIDGELRIYDPYTDKILDPNNDQYIPSNVYPNLKSYPTNKTSGIVGIVQTGQSPFNWTATNFFRPSKEHLIVYELLLRDFVTTHSYNTLIDTLSYFKKLGINAIELMPISEFEGNSSWGYNPMTYFAPDKYYGTKNDLKTFIDACHQNGIAVIMDIVLNHAYGSNSMVQMYWNKSTNRPAANNPWFNQSSPNPIYSWGYDFNHESAATKYFVDRVTSYWLTEYKIDGFRFDFTKGFTNTPGEGTPYDAARIIILKRIANKIWSVVPNAYVILEHFCANSEEMDLSNHGILLWGNLNYNYNEATMGYVNTSNFNNISYLQRGWSFPNLVGYMESHDEERLMYKNLTYGNSSGGYNVKDLNTALNRMKLAATFFFTVPGPKMIWMGGELGYDVSIESNGRLSEKPFAWNYYSVTQRKSLFNTFSALIRLKKYYPAFSSNNFDLNAIGSTKVLKINHNSMNVNIIGNFDVTVQNATPTFQSTGKWYEFFTGDSLNVTDINMQISLQPGEYRLYTSKKISKASDLVTEVNETESLPLKFKLEQNYPNPFNPTSVISYQLTVNSHVSLKIYDVLGREITTLVNEEQQAGIYHLTFNTQHLTLPSGVYFYRLQAGHFVQTKKMILLK